MSDTGPANAAASSTVDVGHLLDHGPWSPLQKVSVLLAALVIVFDGLNNQVVGFAVPAILRDWGVTRSVIAPVLASGLFGMVCGTALGGPFGDRFGRRIALVSSLAIFGMGTFASAAAPGVFSLTLLRFLAGVGLGVAMPNAGTLAAEFTPVLRRPLAVTCTIVCLPLGGMLAGLLALHVLPAGGWRMLFAICGASPLALGVVLWFLLPESPRFMARRRSEWGKLSALLARFGQPVGENVEFVDVVEQKVEGRTAMKTIFGARQLFDTLSLWLSFFCCLSAVYMVFSWLPAMLTAQGLDLATASSGLASYNFGGVLGALCFALLVGLTGSRILMLAAVVGGSASALFLKGIPMTPSAGHTMVILALGMHGFFVNSAQTALYALVAHVYPTKVRATGSAWAIALGRVGAVLAAFFGGAVIQMGRGAYLDFLAVAMAGTFVGLALIRNHIPRDNQR